MAAEEINNLESIFNFTEDTTILAQKITPLTAPGENYGSLMLKVDVTARTSEGVKVIYVAAKMVPLDERTRQHFNTESTFRNEIAFYKHMVPLLQNFQREHGVENVINFFPKYYGSRLNLKGDNSTVDGHGVLLLKNLKIENYRTLERTEGFDLDVAKLVITNLALFHAVPLALRIQKKEIFEKEFLPFLSPWRMDKEFHNKTKKELEKTIEKLPELVSFKRRILAGFDKKLQPSQCRQPFATITHNDCWVNNNMIKFDGTTPIKHKMVDFQECTYSSPAKDVIFFLFSSVKNHILKEHYDDLVQLYHKTFTSELEALKCDVKNFSFDAFEKELAFEAEHSQFGHLIFMLYPIFAQKSEKEQCGPDDLLENEPTDLHKEKLVFVVQEFAKRNWI